MKNLNIPLDSRRANRLAGAIPMLGFAMLCVSASTSNAANVEVLVNGDISAWSKRTFVGETRYDTTVDEGQKTVLRARSRASASGYFRKLKVDLKKTPHLSWRWRVERIFDNPNEETPQGDDYPARIYVIAKHPRWPWKKIALCYVWSSRSKARDGWPSPYAETVHIVVVRDSETPSATWQTELRDVREDFARFLGHDVKIASAIGLMTDTDNLSTVVESHYGDIAFTR